MAGFKKKSSKLRVFKAKPRKVLEGEHELLITSLSDDGRGVARVKGKTVFVAGALPGETVKASYTDTRKQFDQAICKRVIEPSEHRVKPACQHFGECGGCSLQHLNHAQQLIQKQAQLQQLFAPHKQQQNDDIDWQPSISSSPEQYRHRVRFTVKANKSQCSLGFKRLSSHQITAVEHCHIADQHINDFIPVLKQLITRLKMRSRIQECSVAIDHRNMMALSFLVKEELPASDNDLLCQFSRDQALSLQISLSAMPYSKPLLVFGDETLIYELSKPSLIFKYRVSDFTQVNTAVNEQMIAQGLAWLAIEKNESVADFFCGIGNISLPLATLAYSVLGVELVDEMVVKAQENMILNQLTNCRFVRADLFKGQVELPRDVTKVVLDPPRAGAKHLCEQLAKMSVERILYISCNPVTLARDVEILQQGGYKISKASLIDMFPHTHHLEAMLLLER